MLESNSLAFLELSENINEKYILNFLIYMLIYIL